MLELLSAILIIAVLATMVTFFTASYIQWSQQVADQRTLVVLNDALTRYKCEGGDLTALTSGAPAGHIISKLTNPINWNGYVHQVMQTGVTYSSKSLTGAGYHQTFKFTGYNSYSTPVNPGQDIVDRLASQGTPPDSATANWIQANATSPYYLVLSQPSSSNFIKINVQGTGTLNVNWGDDTSNTYSLSGSSTQISHTYGSASTFGVIMSGQVTFLTSYYSPGTSFGLDISSMPCLTHLDIQGTGIVSGSVTGMTGLNYLSVGGPNTITGNISKLSSLSYVNAAGSNTLSGDITNLTSLTYFYVRGNGSFSGSITNLTGLTAIDAIGPLTGSITNLSSLNHVYIRSGSATVSGDITNLTNLTYFSYGGSGNLTGTVTNLTGLTLLSVGGSVTGSIATITGLQYLQEYNTAFTNPSDWSAFTVLCNVIVEGLSTQSAVDNFLISMDNNKNVTKPRSERYIDCHTSCGTPSAAGYAAKADLIASGWTVITN